MKKKKISFVLNVFIILFELLAISYNIIINHSIYLVYYTELANILALVSSSLYVGYLVINKDIPKYVSILKYASVVCLSITLLVVLFILFPMSNFNYSAMFFEGVLLYHHFLCPLLSIVSFIFFDELGRLNKSDIFYSLLFTCIYAILLIVLNIVGSVDGPYPFLKVKNQSIISSILWMLIIFGFSYVSSYLIMYYYNRRVK